MSLLHDYMKVSDKLSSKVSEEELKKICDQIQSEEKIRFKNENLMPKGEGIFLSLETEKDQDVEYVTIEKDSRGFFTGYWIGKISTGKPLTRVKSWPLVGDSAHKIVLSFIMTLKYITEYVKDEATIF